MTAPRLRQLVIAAETLEAADQLGELLELGAPFVDPGVKEFGEDPEIDRLIRKYGYAGTETVLRLVDENRDLRESLGTAAHLIHGSTEERFTVVYCPGHLSRQEVEGVNFSYADPESMLRRYSPGERSDGYHRLPDGEEFYLVKNPALGLWTARALDE